MYKDQNSSSGSGASTKGDEVEIVSRFLAPLCARDETARNIALAAARTTVEGWIGGMSGPNQTEEDTREMENCCEEQTGKFRGQDGRYDMSIERSPTKTVPKPVDHYYFTAPNSETQLQNYPHNLHDTFRTEGFFPQSMTDHGTFPCDSSLDSTERYPSGSYDCTDGRIGICEVSNFGGSKDRWNHHRVEAIADKLANSNSSSDEGKGLRIVGSDKLFRECEGKCSSSSDSERKIFDVTSEKLSESFQEESKLRLNKIKSGRQKQLEDDELDSDTRIYGKSPKFDDNMGSFGHFETNYGNYLKRSSLFEFSDDTLLDDDVTARRSRNRDGVVFNTLDGFENEFMVVKQDCDSLEDMKCVGAQQDYLRNTEDRKFSAGQIKRPLSQDEDVSAKSGRVLEGPEVTPGDVGRMLNLGNALDGPRPSVQSNKYLSLVMLHLPVILRLSVNCPFHNVRIKCAEILQMVKDRGFPIPESAFDGPSAFVPTSEARRIVTHFSHSEPAARALKEAQKERQIENPLSLIQMVVTRFNSEYLMLNRMIKLKNSLVQVIFNTKMDDILSSTEWDQLDEISKILQPLTTATELASGNTYPTLSMVIPLIQGINHKLSKVKELVTSEMAQNVVKNLVETISARFEPSSEEQKATFLDPRFKGALFDAGAREDIQNSLLEEIEEEFATGSQAVSSQNSLRSSQQSQHCKSILFFHYSNEIFHRLRVERL